MCAHPPAYHLAHGDVRVNDPRDLKFVVVRINASKTDPFRKGLSVFLGRTGQILCPVAVNLSYMVQRGGKEGQFFRAWADTSAVFGGGEEGIGSSGD